MIFRLFDLFGRLVLVACVFWQGYWLHKASSALKELLAADAKLQRADARLKMANDRLIEQCLGIKPEHKPASFVRSVSSGPATR